MSDRLRAWLLSLGCGVAALTLPMTAEASHPKPGSDVPWVLLLVGGVLVFAAAWGLTVFFERRQNQRAQGHGPRERSR